MLEINPDTVCAVISRAREFQAQEEVVITEVAGSPSDDWGRQVLANHADNLSFQEVDVLIRDLEPDQQWCLLALLWLGRGDYTLEEWPQALADAEDSAIENIPAALLGTPLVVDYLIEAISQFGYHCSD